MSFQIPIRRGDQHPASRLPNRERHAVRDAVREGSRSITEIARSYHVSRDTIRRIGRQPADWLPDSPANGIE